MATVNETFQKKLEQKLEIRIQEVREQATANIQQDLGAVNYNIGKIAGLREVFDIASDIQTELNTR